jgi:hypothetical protein
MISKKDGLMISTLFNKMQSLRNCADSFKDKNEYLNATFFLDSLKVELRMAQEFNINLYSDKTLDDRINELVDAIPSIERWVDILDKKVA